MEYPEEIYKDINGKEMTDSERLWGKGMSRRRSYYLGHEAGYAKCLAEQSDPLAGYSNLTAAIKAGEPIDWERLDGKKVQCVKSGTGTLTGKLARDHFWPANSGSGWEVCGMGASYVTVTAWRGKDGWTLYIEGDIPLRRKTADDLKVGTYFYGEAPSGEPDLMYVGGSGESSKIIYYAPEMHKTAIPATEWVVIEEYGPFQKPEENKK